MLEILFSFILYTGIIGGAIAGLGNLYTALAGAIGATERVMEILNRPSEVELNSKRLAPEDRLKGEIEYKNVNFSYPTRPDISVLNGINLKIEPGQKIALVGTSGSGKSTIVQLLVTILSTGFWEYFC